MDQYQKSARNTVKRSPKRGHYDRETVYSILDAGFVCHVGFAMQQQPYVIPTAYGREGDTLYLHGAVSNRMLGSLEEGMAACITVTHLDGMVLARSAFHHSVNYRAVVLFGRAIPVAEEEKEHALYVITEHMLPGRWQEVRRPGAGEMKRTKVLAFHIEEASAKIRTGPPKDDAEDYSLPVWAGVVPVLNHAGSALPDPAMQQALPLPGSVQNLLKKP